MSAPESHQEADPTLGPVADIVPELAGSTSLAQENRVSPEVRDRQETLEKVLNGSIKSEARLLQVIETIPAIMWFSLPDGSNEFLNQRWHDFTCISGEAARSLSPRGSPRCSLRPSR